MSLPYRTHHFESSQKGIYVIGDIATAPTIRYAFWEGWKLGTHLIERCNPSGKLDICIVGAGPAGFGLAWALKESSLQYIIIEASEPLSTLSGFPEGKILFGEPQDLEISSPFSFADAPKETWVEQWLQEAKTQQFPMQYPERFEGYSRQENGFKIHTTKTDTTTAYHAQIIVLAIGKRAYPKELSIEGAKLPHVHLGYHPVQDSSCVVIGGGDSAVETALRLSQHNPSVVLAHRSQSLYRPKKSNINALNMAVEQNKIQVVPHQSPLQITPSAVHFSSSTIPAEAVFVEIGTQAPTTLFQRFQLRLKDQWSPTQMGLFGIFCLFVYLFYLFKQGTHCMHSIDDICVAYANKHSLFPFSFLQDIPSFLRVDLSFRTVDGSFWGTVLYSALITGFGIRALRKYPDEEQQKRYKMLIGYQLLFLFGIPEIIAPLLIHNSQTAYDFFGGERGWKIYSLTVPWPLNMWAFVDAPNWTATKESTTVLAWLGFAMMVSFGLIPLYVRKQGLRFCSYLCGCGGLAETVGDFWRDLTPRGAWAKKMEHAGRFLLVLCIPVTLLIVMDAWQLLHNLHSTAQFVQYWYPLMVDFWLASVLGVALYPYLGNRFWCRFLCPLRAYMEIIAQHKPALAITANDKCIACGTCTQECQMGIDVQQFALRQESLSNNNSSCIQCGICISVCPLNVLSIGKAGSEVHISPSLFVPSASWEKHGVR